MQITITGADERTSIVDLALIAADSPFVEIGLLYTATPEGRNRYPSREWLEAATEALSGRCAIHICGRAARAQLVSGELASFVRHAPRIQVNGVVTADELPVLGRLVPTLITQHNAVNAGLASIAVGNHSLLVDGSGGRGISPARWESPDTSKPVGYAGGLGPDNLTSELAKIAFIAEGGWWVDMEGKLRTDDWFDIASARTAVQQFSSAI